MEKQLAAPTAVPKVKMMVEKMVVPKGMRLERTLAVSWDVWRADYSAVRMADNSDDSWDQELELKKESSTVSQLVVQTVCSKDNAKVEKTGIVLGAQKDFHLVLMTADLLVKRLVEEMDSDSALQLVVSTDDLWVALTDQQMVDWKLGWWVQLVDWLADGLVEKLADHSVP
jgi:hypothetical protein